MTADPKLHESGDRPRMIALVPRIRRLFDVRVGMALAAVLAIVAWLAISPASAKSAASLGSALSLKSASLKGSAAANGSAALKDSAKAAAPAGSVGGTIVANGPTVSAAITSTGSTQDNFTFPGTMGEIVTAWATGGTFPAGTVSLVIQSSAGVNVSATVDASQSGFIGETVLPGMDTYTLDLFTNVAVSGSVTLGLSTDAANGTIAANGPAVTFTSTSPGQGEHFAFPATAGEVVTAQASGGTFPAKSLSMVIEDSGANFLNVPVDASQAGVIAPTLLATMGTDTLDLFANAAVSGTVTVQLFTSAALPPAPVTPVFTPVTPARDLDTRSGTGGTKGPVAGKSTFNVTVAGVNGVPATGVGAVALNVTVTNPTCAAWLTVYPTGQPLPSSSNLNYVAGATIANLVVVGVGTGGQVSFNIPSACAGTVQVLADIQGWYAVPSVPPRSGAYTAVTPGRDLDTRSGAGGTTGPVAGNKTFNLTVAGVNGVPASGVGAVVLNVTVATPTCAAWVTVFPTGQALPASSNVNFVASETVPSLVMVGVGTNGQVSFNVPSACAGTVQLIADIQGWYASPGTTSGSGGYTAIAPGRDLDTRSGTGGTTGPVAGNKTFNVTVGGVNGVPASGVGAVVLSVTVANPTCAAWLTVYPAGQPLPVSSTLNYPAGATVSNLAIVAVGTNGQVTVNVPSGCVGTVQVIVDVQGWYAT